MKALSRIEKKHNDTEGPTIVDVCSPSTSADKRESHGQRVVNVLTVPMFLSLKGLKFAVTISWLGGNEGSILIANVFITLHLSFLEKFILFRVWHPLIYNTYRLHLLIKFWSRYWKTRIGLTLLEKWLLNFHGNTFSFSFLLFKGKSVIWEVFSLYVCVASLKLVGL